MVNSVQQKQMFRNGMHVFWPYIKNCGRGHSGDLNSTLFHTDHHLSFTKQYQNRKDNMRSQDYLFKSLLENLFFLVFLKCFLQHWLICLLFFLSIILQYHVLVNRIVMWFL